MKKLLLLGSAFCAALSFGQTDLFTDDFESGTSQWTLNTGTGGNNWIVNNSYTGYPNLIPDTPNQSTGISGSPQSNYLHIVNGQICSLLSVCNANFDTGSASNQNAELSNSIDASNYTDVEVSFWYICAGAAGTSFGNLEYSLDGGSTWTSTGTEYSGVSTWTQETVSLPAWNNAANFKIRFKWQNGGGGNDPAFSIDDVTISAMLSAAANITTESMTPQTTSWCYGQEMSFDINFTASGSFNSGNIFTAELSDANGSFTTPTSIGNLNSSSSGSLSVTGTISNSTAIGTGYRIRIVSSDPVTIGTDNGQDLSVLALPTVQFDSIPNICLNSPSYTLSEGSPAGGIYSGSGVSNGDFNPATAGVGTSVLTYTYVDGNGCSATDTQEITVEGCASIDENNLTQISVFPNPAENFIFISTDVSIQHVELFDTKGGQVKQFENFEKLELDGINAGVYFLHINHENGNLIERVVIK